MLQLISGNPSQRRVPPRLPPPPFSPPLPESLRFERGTAGTIPRWRGVLAIGASSTGTGDSGSRARKRPVVRFVSPNQGDCQIKSNLLHHGALEVDTHRDNDDKEPLGRRIRGGRVRSSWGLLFGSAVRLVTSGGFIFAQISGAGHSHHEPFTG